MKINSWHIVICIIFLLSYNTLLAQDDVKITTEEVVISKKKKKKKRKEITYNPLAPARAAFYSAVLPGLGQVYTKKYWKVPIVYAALGTGVYFYMDRNKEYNKFRDVYKRRLAGFTDDEFSNVDNSQLISFQKTLRQEQELALLVTIGLYLINIIDANVSAHLQQYNVNNNLSLHPQLLYDEFKAQPKYGVSLQYHF